MAKVVAYLEKGAQHVSDRLVDLAEIQAGQRVLDVATGIGEPAVTAARRVGAAGRVVATDQAPQMLAIARERAAELGLQNIDFHKVDAEVLDFPEQSFNAILCRWGLMFFPNLPATLRQMGRLLIPGGRLAAAVWDVSDKVRTMSLYIGVARQVLGLPPPPPGTPSLFSLADVPALEQKLE
ncbi:MAG: class I SAM-dependent methyltransferase, partial [Candidatus Binatia bacterium]